MNGKKVYEKEFHGRKIVVETGELAKQADGATLVRYGDSAVLTAAVMGKEPSSLDFFPLFVRYREKLYSVGKIPGGFLRREGRPSEHETLSARVIDRTLRPLFADGFRYEVQVINTILSVDPDNTPEMSALFGSSLALKLGGVPFEGPVAGVIVGRVDGEFICNPTTEQLASSDLELTVAGTKDAINMVEAGAKEIDEDIMIDALMFAHENIRSLIEFQDEIIADVAKERVEVELKTVPDSLRNIVNKHENGRIKEALSVKKKLEREETIENIENEVIEELTDIFIERGWSQEDRETALKQAKTVLEEIKVAEIRRQITQDKTRPDGRRVNELRALNAQIDLFNRTHGSALFTRGETQALATVTLGALGEAQIIDGVTVEEGKRFMLHYNFPPYSVGETGRYFGPGRREIGHGALGRRALFQVMPEEDDFPYTLRVVSEILESNGSSSQATICAGSMALMAAGVPIKAPVAGIAMGLIKEGDDYTILTDIQGVEDHYGDMDFKVAGTNDGITALQMDIKIAGITKEIFKEALAQAKIARLEILDTMNKTIAEPRKELSEYAPKVKLMHVKPEKIREIIGSGGKTIQSIIEKCNDVKIDIEDDGRVTIMHEDTYFIDQAVKMIEDIVREVEVGEVYTGRVTRTERFGAFVELWPGTEGLVHISKLALEHIRKTEDVVNVGDAVTVKVINIDDKGRIDLSRKALLKKVKNDK